MHIDTGAGLGPQSVLCAFLKSIFIPICHFPFPPLKGQYFVIVTIRRKYKNDCNGSIYQETYDQVDYENQFLRLNMHVLIFTLAKSYFYFSTPFLLDFQQD